MTFRYDKIRGDVLALLGESPGLPNLLEEDEESNVLTIDRMLKPHLASCALQATLASDPLFLDEIVDIYPDIEWLGDSHGRMRMPEDFLTLQVLKMTDWGEPLMHLEAEESLRGRLGSRAPGWLVNARRPMAMLRRDGSGLWLYFAGSDSHDGSPELLSYVRRPSVSTSWTVALSGVAYPEMIALLAGKIREADNR